MQHLLSSLFARGSLLACSQQPGGSLPASHNDGVFSRRASCEPRSVLSFGHTGCKLQNNFGLTTVCHIGLSPGQLRTLWIGIRMTMHGTASTDFGPTLYRICVDLSTNVKDCWEGRAGLWCLIGAWEESRLARASLVRGQETRRCCIEVACMPW